MIVCLYRIDTTGFIDEDILAAFVELDKSEPLFLIEEFNGAKIFVPAEMEVVSTTTTTNSKIAARNLGIIFILFSY